MLSETKTKKFGPYSQRRDFNKSTKRAQVPNLIENQIGKYQLFLTEGIQNILDEVFPIINKNENIVIDLNGGIIFEEPTITPNTARLESKTYHKQLFLPIILMINDYHIDINLVDYQQIKDETQIIQTFLEQKLKQKLELNFHEKKQWRFISHNQKIDINAIIIEQNNETIKLNLNITKQNKVFLGYLPKMTHKGTFIVNGSEKVVVSQLVRSSGAYYKKQLNQKLGIYNCFFELIPNRGTWLEFETSFASPYDNPNFDINNSVYVKVDKSKKATLTNLFTVFGISRQDIELLFDKDYLFHNCYRQTGWTDDNHLNFEEAVLDIYKKIKTGESVNPEGGAKYIYSLLFDDRKYDLSKVGRYKFQQKLAIENRVYGYTLAEPIYDDQGEIFLKKGTVLKTKKFQMLKKALQDGYCTSHVKVKKDVGHKGIISKIVIYRKDIHNEDANPITVIGPDPHTTTRQLLVGDILAAVSYWYNLLNHIGVYDDIDHLSNRRVRSVGEILQNQFRIGMFRIEKFSTEQLNNTSDVLGLKPINLINSKLLTSVITEFFNISQLCQFMDQTNPLAELTNKRRITALGPGGLSKEHAMIDVRDVHYSHYSRICPIETPEGPNIGLINNIATFTKINEYGFLVAPYYRVKNKKVSFMKVHYLTANEEYNHIIAQGKMNLNADKTLRENQLIARYQGANILADADDVEYFDVSPNQIVSVAAACIPFLENDDANRALMGANMQRQAVPLLNPATPIVATGMEHVAARDSGLAVVSTQHGKVTYVDATEIIIQGAEETKVYHLDNFMRSNQATLLHHTPLVRVGDKVAPNDIIADGSGIKNGELALGQNVRVAFTTWNGYNYEDAIIISERLVKDDVFTSLHIEEYKVELRKTKIGEETFTREIPNVSENARRHLDEEGFVAIGTYVKPGDILVGKISPKGRAKISPEDKLLNAIFGDKSKNMRESCLRVPTGVNGFVSDIRRFTAKEVDLPKDVLEIVKIFIIKKRKIQEGDKMAGRHGNKGVISIVLPIEDMPYTADGQQVDVLLNPLGILSRMNIGQLLEMHVGYAAYQRKEKIATPVFHGMTNDEVMDYMHSAGCDGFEKQTLYDGLTGEQIGDDKIAVGIMYMLKLSHMVEDKIHARNVGSYSLITQQPLGGKALNGGQRFGEMEVWALQAYGAAYLLREMLTYKSDDIAGRTKIYDAIVNNKKLPAVGVPESFNVLLREIQGLGFNINVLDEKGVAKKIASYVKSSDKLVIVDDLENQNAKVNQNLNKIAQSDSFNTLLANVLEDLS